VDDDHAVDPSARGRWVPRVTVLGVVTHARRAELLQLLAEAVKSTVVVDEGATA
jgi:hypothetical protein